MNSEARFASENAALRKNVIGSIGCGRAQLPGDERRHEGDAEPERGEDLRARPALLVAADQAPDDPEHARR